MDRYRDRDRRSPDRDRSRYAAPTDSYVPSSARSSRPRSRSSSRYRPRSRSPPRVQADTWRGRPHSCSPGRRYDSRVDAYPPRDARVRSPRRDRPSEPRHDEDGRQSRARSPQPLKRAREPSAPGKGERSPAPIKRERVSSPGRDYVRPRSPARRGYQSPALRNEYRPRSRTPPRRDDRPDQYASRSYRRRSPSLKPARVVPRSTEESGRESVATSRRSSPRGQLRRPGNYEELGSHGQAYRTSLHARSPLPVRALQDEDGNGTSAVDMRARQDDESDVQMSDAYPSSRTGLTPAGAADRRDGRGIPTGPAAASRYAASTVMSAPLGPAAAPISMSAHNRPSSTIPPSYPRGNGFRGRGGMPAPRDYPPRDYAGSTSPTRGGRSGWGAGASYGRGAPLRDDSNFRDSYQQDSGSSAAPRNRDFPFPPPPGFRGNNSTSTTYPRTQRFNVPAASVHLADLPVIKPGGERISPLHDMSKAERLEEEAARLRKMIDEKQEQKRQSLREYETLDRQTKTAALRTDLAEENLRKMSEDTSGLGVGGVAAF